MSVFYSCIDSLDLHDLDVIAPVKNRSAGAHLIPSVVVFIDIDMAGQGFTRYPAAKLLMLAYLRHPVTGFALIEEPEGHGLDVEVVPQLVQPHRDGSLEGLFPCVRLPNRVENALSVLIHPFAWIPKFRCI